MVMTRSSRTRAMQGCGVMVMTRSSITRGVGVMMTRPSSTRVVQGCGVVVISRFSIASAMLRVGFVLEGVVKVAAYIRIV